jgi:hypothetical protein
MSSSNSFAALVLGYGFAAQSWATQPIYISLHDGDPGTTGANELSNATYSRQTATFNAISAATSVMTNSSVVTFPTDGNEETATHGGAWNGSSDGTFLFGGALGSSFAYNNGVTPVFDAGAIKLRAT